MLELKNGAIDETIQKTFWLSVKDQMSLFYEYDLFSRMKYFPENRSFIRKNQKLLFYDIRNLFNIFEFEEVLETWISINKNSCLNRNKQFSLFRFTKDSLLEFFDTFIPCVILSPSNKFHGRAFIWNEDKRFMFNLYHSHIFSFFNQRDFKYGKFFAKEEIISINEISIALDGISIYSDIGYEKFLRMEEELSDKISKLEFRDILTCEICGKKYREEDGYIVDGSHICEECYEYETSECSHCSDLHLNERLEWFWTGRKDVAYCENCLDEETSICDICGKRHLNSHTYYLDNLDLTICEECYHEKITICDNCNEPLIRGDGYDVDELGYICEYCYEDYQKEKEEEEEYEEEYV